jgi:hypothetical protein
VVVGAPIQDMPLDQGLEHVSARPADRQHSHFGSAIAPMTIGIVVVACLAASAAGVPQVTMMSTGRARESRA